ncbi:helix-turn-helix domain-containing protein [Pedobacter aquae]|uniref:Helix-turn-helix domain-containing protein n=1 Tax=Pedobacter aquae TaxID=2605747 RepID=A0A5C0VGP8_9SPHI|nr:IclR family transcriptional regulator C-terminal domain-containing protein [Pedobacter aquae]QEK51855.1 helix-turn-helix domain-containing protein [Pedobacter aquae]
MIQVINRAIDILEYVANNPKEPKLMGHIADHLNLNTATCANIIKTLVDRGFLKKAEKEKGYLLGDNFTEIASGSFGYKQLLDRAEPELLLAQQALQENCLIAVLKENKRIILKHHIANQLIQATTADEKNAYDASTGRLLVAMLPDKELAQFIKRFGLPDKSIWPEASSRTQLLEQIAIIKKQGYVLIEDSVQVIGIGTPIYQNGKVVAGFSIYMPAFRFNHETKELMIKTALEAARHISII